MAGCNGPHDSCRFGKKLAVRASFWRQKRTRCRMHEPQVESPCDPRMRDDDPCRIGKWLSARALPQKRARCRRQAPQVESPCDLRMRDDDSQNEKEECCTECRKLLRLLLTSDVKEARKISFTTKGAYVELDGLGHCNYQSVLLSDTVAMTLASGVEPASCIALQSGRLAHFGAAEKFQLQQLNGVWILVADSNAFFNFLSYCWQPLGMVTYGPYAPVTDLLYLAFVRQKEAGLAHGHNALFVKLGYRELVQGEKCDHDSLIGYVEKKSSPLQLTNVLGAGIFVFDVPRDHQGFARPGRAAEASLKTKLLHNEEITVTPSGNCGEVGEFSASLEYFFAEGLNAKSDPLIALTRMLQSFTGNPNLLPQRAVASEGGGLRRGRKYLQPWGQAIDLSLGCTLVGDADCGYSAPPRNIINSATNLSSPMHMLRSRAKCAQPVAHSSPKAKLKGVRSRKTW